MARFAVIGVGAGTPFDETTLTADVRNGLERGIADGVKRFRDFKRRKLDTRKITTASLFGTREHLENNYLHRYAGARLGIFGNSAEEVIEYRCGIDASGAALDARVSRYALRFGPGARPPVSAFWSVTMYDGRTGQLVENHLDRYLIDSLMLPRLDINPDGGLTLLMQRDAPAADRISNWLPAPAGPFFLILRLYQPKAEAISGTWQAPPVTLAA
jgi:hypothetical protein